MRQWRVIKPNTEKLTFSNITQPFIDWLEFRPPIPWFHLPLAHCWLRTDFKKGSFLLERSESLHRHRLMENGDSQRAQLSHLSPEIPACPPPPCSLHQEWWAEVALKGSLLVSNFLLALTKETGGMRVLFFQFPPWGFSSGWLCPASCLASLWAQPLNLQVSITSLYLVLQSENSPRGSTVLFLVDSLYSDHTLLNSPFTKISSNYSHIISFWLRFQLIDVFYCYQPELLGKKKKVS